MSLEPLDTTPDHTLFTALLVFLCSGVVTLLTAPMLDWCLHRGTQPPPESPLEVSQWRSLHGLGLCLLVIVSVGNPAAMRLLTCGAFNVTLFRAPFPRHVRFSLSDLGVLGLLRAGPSGTHTHTDTQIHTPHTTHTHKHCQHNTPTHTPSTTRTHTHIHTHSRRCSSTTSFACQATP